VVLMNESWGWLERLSRGRPRVRDPVAPANSSTEHLYLLSKRVGAALPPHCPLIMKPKKTAEEGFLVVVLHLEVRTISMASA
jgi:hypothetical protein